VLLKKTVHVLCVGVHISVSFYPSSISEHGLSWPFDPAVICKNANGLLRLGCRSASYQTIFFFQLIKTRLTFDSFWLEKLATYLFTTNCINWHLMYLLTVIWYVRYFQNYYFILSYKFSKIILKIQEYLRTFFNDVISKSRDISSLKRDFASSRQ